MNQKTCDVCGESNGKRAWVAAEVEASELVRSLERPRGELRELEKQLDGKRYTENEAELARQVLTLTPELIKRLIATFLKGCDSLAQPYKHTRGRSHGWR